MPDTPEQPTTGYRLTFDGGVGVENQTRAHWSDLQGSGNLIFNWDYNSDEETTNEMVMAFYKEKFIASTTGNYHTYASIHRHSDPEKQQDNHYASFTTVEKYDRPLSSGDYEDCRVVALTPLRADNDTYIYSLESRVIANLPMPGTFEQNDYQEPDFLSNYMYMYADASITDGTAFLLFEHIPATFRFKITNKRPEPARINSVKVTVVDTEGVEQPVASQFPSPKSRTAAKSALLKEKRMQAGLKSARKRRARGTLSITEAYFQSMRVFTVTPSVKDLARRNREEDCMFPKYTVKPIRFFLFFGTIFSKMKSRSGMLCGLRTKSFFPLKDRCEPVTQDGKCRIA